MNAQEQQEAYAVFGSLAASYARDILLEMIDSEGTDENAEERREAIREFEELMADHPQGKKFADFVLVEIQRAATVELVVRGEYKNGDPVVIDELEHKNVVSRDDIKGGLAGFQAMAGIFAMTALSLSEERMMRQNDGINALAALLGQEGIDPDLLFG